MPLYLLHVCGSYPKILANRGSFLLSNIDPQKKMGATWPSETLVPYHNTTQRWSSMALRNIVILPQHYTALQREDGCSMTLRNIVTLPHHYTVSQPRSVLKILYTFFNHQPGRCNGSIRKVPGSNLWRGTRYRGFDLSWFSSVPTCKCWTNILK